MHADCGQSFKWLQIVGFALLVYGTFLFNGEFILGSLKWGSY
jgi:hypothetical protein